MYTSLQIAEAIKASLSNELRHKQYQNSENPLTGHCYVASEAFYHLVRTSGDHSCIVDFRQMRWEDESHWYCVAVDLKTFEKTVWDITASQFKTTPDYRRGRVVSFLTVWPSQRAQIVIARALNILEHSRTSSEYSYVNRLTTTE